ncbi:DUF305 domain-containing protein [Cryobacterium aureum]|uniref:DUF305 domain-containing protein n=1 Tax=Cryobacterium aureum TaxID=995037 RepID=UPI000CF43C7F|nr:DUF305 domain-containing protein [Cryobacterium aureum]
MIHARVPFLIIAALTVGLTLSACAGAPPATTADSNGSPAADVSAASAFNSDDVMFAQLMIPHHEQAVEMSDDLLAKDGVDPAIIDLATQIKAAQAPEITTMQGWLNDWDATEDGMAGMDHGTDGMMSNDDMMALQDASGADAGALYLTQMIMHHEGAIAMAKTELSDGSSADALALAEAIVSSQSIEIAVMDDLLVAN